MVAPGVGPVLVAEDSPDQRPGARCGGARIRAGASTLSANRVGEREGLRPENDPPTVRAFDARRAYRCSKMQERE